MKSRYQNSQRILWNMQSACFFLSLLSVAEEYNNDKVDLLDAARYCMNKGWADAEYFISNDVEILKWLTGKRVTKTFVFEKRQFNDEMKLEARIARDISQFIRENLTYFQSFSNVILYYDNGQKQLSRILNTILATEIVEYDVRKVKSSDYRLFQVADLICTIELMNKKFEEGENISKSEQYIFHNKRDFRKDFSKKIIVKRFDSI